MTKALHDLGANVTYSGDQPFLMRMVVGNKSDDTKKEEETRSDDTKKQEETKASRMILYVSENENFPSKKVHPVTGRRLDLTVPLRETMPPECLIFLPHISSICPDATHMMIRLVEWDIKNIAELIVKTKTEWKERALRTFEKNLTDRELDPNYSFTISAKQKIVVQPISMSGRKAMSIMADHDELRFADNFATIVPLFEGVFTHKNTHVAEALPVKVLCSLGYGKLFCRDNNGNPVEPEGSGLASLLDLCELLRSSLRQCMRLLRDSERSVQVIV